MRDGLVVTVMNWTGEMLAGVVVVVARVKLVPVNFVVVVVVVALEVR